ncbi:GNAT family N-acetyltransferase [Roseibium salinum]|uniref:GNAT family N-acetyltransferase n=1 Tax=Roseibium salinum TaxID=1604349 RepID=A0ABT3R4J7_9HYPH|nr:GNAT family N-acetyltransferase [Roseibium sp. DSM 29163]MCX2724197.1 GNAT family N-acetyltransferase [Roseibium sp. DSM 29163]MDN3721742.1 N-acetyltransferase family protein [Roseibium salinum]
MKIRDAEPRDIPAILALYNLAVRETTAAWTTREETLDDRLTWFESRKKQGLPVLVACDGEDEVVGFASYGPFRAKEGYRLTAEHSVYVDPNMQRQGIGNGLLKRLVEAAAANGVHVLVSVIDGENAASIALHEKHGFEVIGRMPEIGTKFGRWLDLVLMTKVLQSAPAPER